MNNLLIISILSCLIVSSVSAETHNEIIVTGTRTPLNANKLPIASTTFDRVDIERLQIKSLQELLSGVAGIDVTNSGGYGKSTSVRMRGTESDHILVVIDGVRIGSATSGAVSFQFIPVDLIERVEIIRGPRSSLWGSDAIGGVIQIFTRKSFNKTQYSLNAGAGTEDTYKSSGAISGNYKSFYYSGSVSYLDTNGIDARSSTTDAKSFDRDGYNNRSFSLRGGYQFNHHTNLDFFVLQSDGNTEFDSTTRDETDFRQRVIGSTLSISPLAFWNINLRASENRDEQIAIDTVSPISAQNVFNTKRRQFSIQNDFSINNNHLVTFGFDYRDDKVTSTTSYAERARDNYGVYSQYIGEIGNNQITASIRTDENEAFGNEVTGGVGWNYGFNNGMNFYASYGTAFKTPTFNELYFPNFGTPDLKPESSESFEVGLGGLHLLGEWDIRGYHTEIDNLIATNNPSPGVFVAANTDSARIIGIEGELSVNWHNWTSSLAVDFLDHEDEATGNRLQRRSTKNLTYDLNYNQDKWQLGGRINARGDRYNNAANTTRVGGFVTIDMTGEYQLNKKFSLRGRVGNLLDKDYETVDTFNSLGRNVFFSIHYKNL